MRKYLKVAAGVLGAVLTYAVANQGSVPEKYQWVLGALVLVATGLGIYHAPYQPSAKTAAAASTFDDGGKDAGHGDVGCVLIAAAVSIVVLALSVALHLI